jgi:polysaccharide export outer membrane protein
MTVPIVSYRALFKHAFVFVRIVMPRPCHLALLISLLALAGCSGLPSAGPSADGLVAGSSDALATYRMIDIDLQTVNLLEQRNSATSFAGFATRERSPDLRIGPGDRLSVHIWEASAGGLFSGPLSVDHFSTGARGTTIPDQIVGRDGAISVPYAGRIAVIGRSPLQVQAAIEKKLAG